MSAKKIVIVGGGFGGVRCALDLARFTSQQNSKILLISDRPHFEYTPALYRVVTGRSPLEVCIPLSEIFHEKPVEVIEDSIEEVRLNEKRLKGSSGAHYTYDCVVLALGSETNYFNIPGLSELSFGFKSIHDALRLRRHLLKLFGDMKERPQDEKIRSAHFVVVGGGATGTELAAELSVYLKKAARRYRLDRSLITIDLIEASSRILSGLPEGFSRRVTSRLHRLGINIFVNREVIREEVESVFLKDMQMQTKTVIWTAGAKPHHLYHEIDGFMYDKKGRVIVDRFLRVEGYENVFIAGDGAATSYSGMAQTALNDGQYIARFMAGSKIVLYTPMRPVYAIPVGPGWAGALLGSFRFYGFVGWVVRRLADLRFFLSVLPLRKAISAFRSGKTLCVSCSICSSDI